MFEVDYKVGPSRVTISADAEGTHIATVYNLYVRSVDPTIDEVEELVSGLLDQDITIEETWTIGYASFAGLDEDGRPEYLLSSWTGKVGVYV